MGTQIPDIHKYIFWYSQLQTVCHSSSITDIDGYVCMHQGRYNHRQLTSHVAVGPPLRHWLALVPLNREPRALNA